MNDDRDHEQGHTGNNQPELPGPRVAHRRVRRRIGPSAPRWAQNLRLTALPREFGALEAALLPVVAERLPVLSERAVVWSRDSTRVAFLARTAEDAANTIERYLMEGPQGIDTEYRLMVYDLASRKVREVVERTTRWMAPLWLSGDRALVCASELMPEDDRGYAYCGLAWRRLPEPLFAD